MAHCGILENPPVFQDGEDGEGALLECHAARVTSPPPAPHGPRTPTGTPSVFPEPAGRGDGAGFLS